MSLKIHILDTHLNLFPDNCGQVIDGHEKRFHQDLVKMKQQYHGSSQRWVTIVRSPITNELMEQNQHVDFLWHGRGGWTIDDKVSVARSYRISTHVIWK
ncbi:hypothetical protein Trydic_g4550 [Trypoxylus dichotomus]